MTRNLLITVVAFAFLTAGCGYKIVYVESDPEKSKALTRELELEVGKQRKLVAEEKAIVDEHRKIVEQELGTETARAAIDFIRKAAIQEEKKQQIAAEAKLAIDESKALAKIREDYKQQEAEFWQEHRDLYKQFTETKERYLREALRLQDVMLGEKIKKLPRQMQDAIDEAKVEFAARRKRIKAGIVD